MCLKIILDSRNALPVGKTTAVDKAEPQINVVVNAALSSNHIHDFRSKGSL